MLYFCASMFINKCLPDKLSWRTLFLSCRLPFYFRRILFITWRTLFLFCRLPFTNRQLPFFFRWSSFLFRWLSFINCWLSFITWRTSFLFCWLSFLLFIAFNRIKFIHSAFGNNRKFLKICFVCVHFTNFNRADKHIFDFMLL